MDNRPYWLPPQLQPSVPPTITPVLGIAPHSFVTEHYAAVYTAKNEIDSIAPVGQWDDAKKITNPYEYIFLSLARRMNRSIAGIQPLSRSYFKMIEMWNQLSLDSLPLKKSAHTAEGPGGFLEAIQKYRNIPMTAMTLKSTEKTIPGWRKSAAFLSRYPQVHITYGSDGTGNIYNLANQLLFASLAAPAQLYTADGGFDFSADFNGQENIVQRLVAAEALAALNCLESGGVMILKIFDTTTRSTLELLWLLTICFKKTALIKPHTSRPANSERYWIGYGLLSEIPQWVKDTLVHLTVTDAPHGWQCIFDRIPWQKEWLDAVLQFQAQLEIHQLTAIKETLTLIREPTRERISILLERNISNSRNWCQTNKIPENPAYHNKSTKAILGLNLEEALAPFQVLDGHTHLPALFQQRQMHHVSFVAPLPHVPTGQAWRSTVPPSVLGRKPSQTILGNVPSTLSDQEQNVDQCPDSDDLL